MRVEIFDAGHPGWPEALQKLSHDFYHEPAYLRIEGRRIQATPEAILACEGEKLFFLPYLVRSCAPVAPGNSLPDDTADVISPYGYPGLLLSEAGQEPNFACRALQALRETLAAKGVCSGFFRMHPLLNVGVPSLFPPDVFTDNGETVAIDLGLDERELWRQIRENHKTAINKCRKAGFVARMVPLSEYMDDFLVIYRETMERVKAKASYFFDRDYFAELARCPERVLCAITEWAGKVAAACVFFECDGITQAHLGGTKTEFFSKSPFVMLLYEAALAAKRRGSRFLHLGGGLNCANDKLLNFKAGFSPLRYRFSTLRMIVDEDRYHQMVDLRARAMHVSPNSLLASPYFPAYRCDASFE